jgi:hypothetical protein
MPKATLTFNLPEEQADYNLTLKATAMSLVIWEFTNELRAKAKYSEKGPESWDEVKDLWWARLKEYDVDPYTE